MSTRDNPFERLERMFDQFSRQLDDAAHRWDTERFPLQERLSGSMGVDVRDRSDEFVVTADVPGFERDDIDVRIADATLSIDASHEESAEEREETYIRKERERRSFGERVRLPEPIVEDEIEATLANGALTLRLPKAAPAEPGGRRIEIE